MAGLFYKNQGIPIGTIEIFGERMYQRLHLIGVIESVYREFGFDPLSTPILEHANVFKGHHGEGEELLFNLRDKKLTELVLRYDLTVPLARYICDHPEAPIPFKRYQIAQVFRDDEVDNGHFREFTQCDGDIVGISDLTADAEIINMAYSGLTKLGFPDFVLNINNRKIIQALADKSGLRNKTGRLQMQRALDAISKFSEKWPHHNDQRYQEPYANEIHRILDERRLTKRAVETIQEVFMCSGDFDQKIISLNNLLIGFPEATLGIEELIEIVSYLDPVVKEKINLDLSLARGADYYTGFILEGSLVNMPIGAILGGGRFDNLIKNLGGPNLPAVGMAFGLDRILVALNELEALPSLETDRMIVVPQQHNQRVGLLNLTHELRRQNNHVDYIPMLGCSNEEISEYAKKRGFSTLVISDNTSVKYINL